MENISRIISILLFMLMLCGLFYGVDKGIDITDEAFYVMGYAHQQEACYGMSEFQKMIPGFFPGNLGNLEMARYARLMAIFFSCAIFALSWSRYREKSPRSKEAADAFLWSVIFSFGTYMMGPPAISYNSFSSACILIIVSLGIGLIREKNLITLLSGMSMMGIFSAVLFYIKFSNALAGPATMLLLLILRERKDLNRNELKNDAFIVLAFISGALLWLFMRFGDSQTFFSFTGNYVDILNKMAQSGSHHGVSGIMERYRINLTEKSELILAHSFSIILATLLFRFTGNAKKGKTTFIAAVVLYILLISMARSLIWPIEKITEDSMINMYLTCLTPLFMAGIFNTIRLKDYRALFLLLLPAGGMLCGSVGTSNALTTQWIVYLNLIGITAFMSLRFNENEKPSFASNLLLPITAIGMIIQLYAGYYLHPYRVQGSLAEQTEEIMSGPLKGHYVEKNLADLMDDLQTGMRKHGLPETGSVIYANSHEIGLVYALGGLIPSVAWNTPDNGSESLQLLNKSDKEIEAIISSDKEPISAEMLKEFSRRGMPFPEAFIKEGEYHCDIAGFERTLTLYVKRETPTKS